MHWSRTPSAEETALAKRLRPASKFFKFLWSVRNELFDDGFEDELIAAYAPRGQEPCPPALLAMAMLLQRYEGVSDADAVELAENDRRWQLVLSCLGCERAPFGQGSLVRFRVRMIAHDLDKRLVARTVEIAKKSGGFGWQKLRISLDSSPLAGAGRVEDTWNLIGRAMSKVVAMVSAAVDVEEATIIQEAELNALTADSLKAALDIDWDDDDAQRIALTKLLAEVSSLEAWVKKRAQKESNEDPLKSALVLLRRVVDQDTEPDPDGGARIVDGTAKNRLISLGDVEMRHGRKSSSKRIDGYKRHVAVANGLVLATAVEPANVREHAPAAGLLTDVQRYGEIAVVDIDRGYLASPAVAQLHKHGVIINSRAWNVANGGLFTKEAFAINLKDRTVRCPNGVTTSIPSSNQVFFSERACGACPRKAKCTSSTRRSLTIHENEGLLIQLRSRRRTPTGRAELRKRVIVEHTLARIGAIQGTKARYRGVRKNELDLNRAAAVLNLMVASR
ncbi:MAG: IS1182 family transposase [Deltaproteobacteria bacterium]|nr:IS1182 family transposase [Deltaproteobacteria bacterium]